MAITASVPAFAGTVVERTLAFVNKKPILLSEVELTRALLKLDEKEALERTIDEVMMFEEASRLLDTPPLPKDVATALLSLQEKAGPGFSLQALKRKAIVQLVIASYIDVRLRPLVRVEDAEVRRIFNERFAIDAQTAPLSLAAPEIHDLLERRALDQKIEEWVASLRRREEVRRPLPR